jgi:hypothetical protein
MTNDEWRMLVNRAKNAWRPTPGAARTRSVSTLEQSHFLWQRKTMHADEIRKMLQATPFQPFKVYLPSDKSFSVPHPDFAWLTPNGRTLIVAPAGSGGVDMLDVPLIARVEVQQKSTTGS